MGSEEDRTRSPPPFPGSDTRPPSELERVLASYVDRLSSGAPLDVSQIVQDHPRIAVQLIDQLKLFESLSPGRGPSESLVALGDYQLLRKVGEGGMGVVYEAWQSSMDRRVALKVLPTGLAADSKALTRFVREAQIAGKLNHPHVVSVYGMGIEKHTPFYTMELVDGQTLAQRLRTPPGTAPRTTPQHWAEAFAAVAEGLQHAHALGIVHRDIKPSNLILDPSGRLRILDFGLARVEGQETLTHSGDLLGTVKYMSPEQVMAKRIAIDHRTDIYSLGVTLYETLAGRPPFLGRTHTDTLSEILLRDPRPLRELSPDIPRDLETIVFKCIEKRPQDRYGTAEALAQDLRRFLRKDPIEARPHTRLERISRKLWQSRKHLLAGCVALLFLVSCALFLIRDSLERLAKKSQQYREIIESTLGEYQLWQQARQLTGGKMKSLQMGRDFLFSGSVLPSGSGRDRIQKSLERLRAAEDLFPRRPEARFHRARGLLLLADEAGAIAEIDELRRSDNGSFLALLLEAALHQSRGRGDLAQQALAGAREAGQGTWVETWFRAQQAFVAGKWKETEKELTELLWLMEWRKEHFLGAPFEYQLGRGIARLECDDYVGACRDFTLAMAYYPEKLLPALLLGQTYLYMGKAEEAASWFEELYRRWPAKDEVALEVACIYSRGINVNHNVLPWVSRLSEGPLRDLLLMDCVSELGQDKKARAMAEEALSKYPALEAAAKAYFLRLLWWTGGKRKRVLELADALLAEDQKNPLTYIHLSLIYHGTGQLEKMKEAVDRGLSITTDDYYRAQFYGQLAWYFQRKGQFDQAEAYFKRSIELAQEFPNHHEDLGMFYWKKGDTDAAVRHLREAVRLCPFTPTNARFRLAQIYHRCRRFAEAEELFRESIELSHWDRRAMGDYAQLLEEQGRWEQALYQYCAGLSVEADPEPYADVADRAAELLLRNPGIQDFSPLDRAIDALERAGRESELLPAHLGFLALAYLRAPARKDLDRALHLAAEANGDRKDQDRSSALAAVRFERGEVEEAVRTLEGTCAVSGVRRDALEQLARYRRALWPRLISCASVDAELECRREEPEAVLSIARSQEDPSVSQYALGLLLERRGDLEGAAAVFRALHDLSPRAVEPVLRLAECSVAAGRPEVAERCLRDALNAIGFDRTVLVGRWLAVALGASKRRPEELLAELPAAEPASVPETDPLPIADLRWLIERLASGEALRIDCGSTANREGASGPWSRDRFYAGGEIYPPPPSQAAALPGSTEAEVYQNERWFPREGSCSGYHIPLPDGDYRVTLHFAEIVPMFAVAGGRIFDVLLEGETVIPALDSAAGGFATPQKYDFPVSVRDGVLDIDFTPIVDNPQLFAFEIRRAG